MPFSRAITCSIALLLLCIPSILAQYAYEGVQHRLGATTAGKYWSVTEQDDSVCKAGSRQFSGRVNVTEGKSIFFWFVESRETPSEKPVMVWLNGGPGGSSMLGFFLELGPCLVNEDGNNTTFNPDSWTNTANMLFIDQPAGVGLSTVDDPELLPRGLDAASADFSTFLSLFYNEIFPQYSENGLVVAGESFGGVYVPRFVSDIIKKQESYARDAVPANITGIVLVDAVDNEYLKYNTSTCDAIAHAIPQCEKLETLCEITMNTDTCLEASLFCESKIDIYFQEEVNKGRHNPYDVRKPCSAPPSCNAGGAAGGPSEQYLNTTWVQKLLGFDYPINYLSINFDLNTKWSDDPAINLPHTGELVYLMEEAKLDILVINGNADVLVNTPGIVRQYENLPWSGQALYRTKPFADWYWHDADGQKLKGGQSKEVEGLALYTVDNAGHMSPADQRPAVVGVVKNWIDNVVL